MQWAKWAVAHDPFTLGPFLGDCRYCVLKLFQIIPDVFKSVFADLLVVSFHQLRKMLQAFSRQNTSDLHCYKRGAQSVYQKYFMASLPCTLHFHIWSAETQSSSTASFLRRFCEIFCF